jgi:seryl-tRNA(Sec) selenium transferase
LPEASLDSRAVVIDHDEDRALRGLQDALRCCATPVIGRLHRGRLWLDLRGADPIDALVDALATLETPT